MPDARVAKYGSRKRSSVQRDLFGPVTPDAKVRRDNLVYGGQGVSLGRWNKNCHMALLSRQRRLL